MTAEKNIESLPFFDRKGWTRERFGDVVESIRIYNSRAVHGFSGGKEEIEFTEKWARIVAHPETKGFGRLETYTD